MVILTWGSCYVAFITSPFHSQPRMDEAVVAPSKVLHLRNLPDSVTEKEVVLLGLPFGRVVNVLLLRQKNQAFLEMGDAASASAMVSYYSSVPATIRLVAVGLFCIYISISYLVEFEWCC